MAHWATSFYDFQDSLIHCYSDPIHPFHHERAAEVRAGFGGKTLLELGSGGGQWAVAAALAGYDVTALEYREAGTAQAGKFAAEHGVSVRALTGDFYHADPGGPFDLVCYWDGFGIGTDDEQRALLGRVPGWLNPDGRALIEVYMPYYWAKHAGFTRQATNYTQTYGFDAGGCRFTDTYHAGNGSRTQSLRCYTPADLRLLLQGTGLTLLDSIPGGQYDTDMQTWHPRVSLAECMNWVAVLSREHSN